MGTSALAGRRVLVSAGPTWVRLDAVRHIANFSSGRTGLVIARALAARGACVRLLLGPGRTLPSDEDRNRLEIVPFVTFDDLHGLVREQVGSRRFDAFIHTAAVSDYRPVREERGKIGSGEEELVLRLRPTPKIVDEVMDLDPEILLVKFKLEAGRAEAELAAIAAASRERSRAELIVANDMAGFTDALHPALLMDAAGIVRRSATTAELGEVLAGELERRLSGRPARSPRGNDGPAPEEQVL